MSVPRTVSAGEWLAERRELLAAVLHTYSGYLSVVDLLWGTDQYLEEPMNLNPLPAVRRQLRRGTWRSWAGIEL